jgi:hypothetical protein
VPFLGFLVFPDHRRVLGAGVRRACRRFHRLQESYAAGTVTVPRLRQSVAGWLGHVRHGDSFALRRSVLEQRVWTKPARDSAWPPEDAGPA